MCLCYSWKGREIIGVGIKTDEHNACYKEQQQTTYHCHYSGSLFSHHNSILSKILSLLSTFAASRWEFSQWAALHLAPLLTAEVSRSHRTLTNDCLLPRASSGT